ncbi:MAG: ATP-binding protein [Saprospiraceae bacterium]
MKRTFYCRNVYVLLFFLFSSYCSIGQKYLFDIQHISIKDGLPNRQVLNLQQDTFGNIWGNSPGMLFKYDGYSFQTFGREELKIIAEDYPTFGIDNEGFVWYRSIDVPVQILNPFTEKVQSVEDFLGTKDIKIDATAKKFITSKGFLPVSTDQYVVQFQGYHGDFYTYKNHQLKSIYKHYEPASFKGTDQGKNQGFVFYNKDTLFSLLPNRTLKKQLAPKYLAHLKIFNDTIYVGYQPNEGIVRYSWLEVKGEKIVPLVFPKKEWNLNGVEDFVVDKLGYKWLISGEPGAKETIVCISPTGKIIYNQPLEVSNRISDLRHLFIDKQNNLWITSTEGLFKITRREIPFKKYIESSNSRGIIRIENKILLANSFEISQIDITSKEISKAINFQHAAVFFKEKNILWIGNYYYNLMRKDLKTGEERLFHFNGKNFMYLPFRPKGSDKLWIGTEQGLCYLTENSDTIQSFVSPDSLLNIATIRQAYQNEQGTWLVTSKGLFLIDANANILNKFNTKTGFPTEEFNNLHEDKNGDFWIGSRGKGLIYWQPKTNTIKVFGRSEGFLNQNIYAVFEDEYGFLWLPSDYGLIRLNKETFEVNTYLPEHGLLHEEFNTYSYHQDKDGNFYFGGLSGVIGFHPKDLVGNTNIEVPLNFTAFKILKNDETKFRNITEIVQNQQILTIKPNDKLFEIYFTLMDFKKKDKLYSYKINGYDNDWNYTTDNFIRINSLPYGTYTLQIRGQIDGTTWTKKHLTMKIKVVKPFYLQTWFIILTISLIGGGFWQFTRYRTAKLLQDKEILENTVQERTATINEQAEALKELDKAKTNFFSNITHEFRTPLTLIIGPVQQMAAEPSAYFLKKRLNSVAKNAQHLLNLINQLLDISKLEGGQMQIEIKHGDIVAFSKSLLDRFEPLAKRKKQTLLFSANPTIWKTYFDEKKWQKIIFNLLSNAIKFTPKDGKIELSLTQVTIENQDTIRLIVKDNGVGIKIEDLKNLFNRFYQVDATTTRVQEGTGIGLSLVKELVELQNGTISVKSEENKGTTFQIQLPVLEATNIPISTIETSIEEVLILPKSTIETEKTMTTSSNTEKLDVLIIEDNSELRTYIGSCLDPSLYNIIEASDGQEGIEKALEFVPDLIISDVMMPRKDGFEVIETIRNNIATSHIPLVLLTAKTALESRLKGFERGADAYLTKPFSPKELALRINKLIEIRQALQQRYQNDNQQTDENNESFAQEDKFITELKTYIIKNMDNPDLKGDKIGQHFGLSRTSLYRKLKALTNQSVTEIIRTQRLAKALELLKTGDFTISEVAYNIGFSSPSHFARAFKKQYGKVPSEMR